MSRVAVIIKTYERPGCLRKCLASIRENPQTRNLQVFVGDDTPKPYGREIVARSGLGGAEFIRLPKNSGVSFGHNALVRAAAADGAKFFLTLDDDHLIRPDFSLSEMKRRIDRYNLDILGGHLFRVGKKKYVEDWQGFLDFTTQPGHLEMIPLLGRLSPRRVYLCDATHQFLLGRIDRLLPTGLWDEEFKTQDHSPFFHRLKLFGDIRIAYSPAFVVDHDQDWTSAAYRQARINVHPEVPTGQPDWKTGKATGFIRHYLLKYGLWSMTDFKGVRYSL